MEEVASIEPMFYWTVGGLSNINNITAPEEQQKDYVSNP
jgi:hypothetical protein